MPVQESITVFLDWCRQRNFWIDPRLVLWPGAPNQPWNDDQGIGVFSTESILRSSEGVKI